MTDQVPMPSSAKRRSRVWFILIGGVFLLIMVAVLFAVDIFVSSVYRIRPEEDRCRQTMLELFDQMENYYVRDEKLPLDSDGRLSVQWMASARSPTLGELSPCSTDSWKDSYVRPPVRLTRFPTRPIFQMPALLLCDRPGNHVRRSLIFRRMSRNERVFMLFSDGSVRSFDIAPEEFQTWVDQVERGAAEPYPPGVYETLHAQLDPSAHQH